MEKVPNWECLFAHRKQASSLSVYEMAGRKQNLIPMKLVDLGEPTSFLDQMYLGCTHRECKSSENIFEEYKSFRFANFSWSN